MARAFALEWIQARLVRGVAPDDILVLGLARPIMESLTACLTGAGVPASFPLIDQSSGTVRLSTIHSAKGLDASHVLLLGAHELEWRSDEAGSPTALHCNDPRARGVVRVLSRRVAADGAAQ